MPEGYKTGTYSSFKLFSESTAGTASYLPQKPLAETKKQTPKARYGGAVKELAPFCGIMKVGGLAQQVTATVTEVDENDDCPPLSQGSDFTPPCSQEQEYELPANTHKRRHEDDETIEGEKLVFGWGRSDEVERSDRPMAAMKTRRGKAGKGGVMMVSNGAKSGVDDFEDAEFLDYSALAEGDAEMGGI